MRLRAGARKHAGDPDRWRLRVGEPGPTSVVTDHIGPLTVHHPAAWRLVPGPAAVPGHTVPLLYLSNAALTVATCLSGTSLQAACPAPVASLPPGGVLVTVEPNLGLSGADPPEVYTVAPPDGRCDPIGADGEVWSVAAGAVITACLREPGLAAAQADFDALVTSIGGRLDVVNRFDLGSPAP